ncbi:unnamed protein product [Orchesella dallaii]|uniref:Shematrin-like protein 1 n=1 Tax=Orchesella dallaii TaxID=48710 RepID=A0ABP1S2R2_9HEXA
MAPAYFNILVVIIVTITISLAEGQYPAYTSSYYRSPYSTQYSGLSNYYSGVGTGYISGSGYPNYYQNNYNGYSSFPGRYNTYSTYNRWNPSYSYQLGGGGGGYNSLGFGGYNSIPAFQQSYGAPYVGGNIGTYRGYKK